MSFDPHASDDARSPVLQQRRDFLAMLRHETRQLVDPDEIMRCCARMLAEHVASDRCAYATVENEDVFVITGDYCRGVPSIVGRWQVAAFGAECLRLMLANEPYVIHDVDGDPRAGADLDAYRATGIQSVICVPLHKAGKFTAAMAVHQTVARRWTEEEIEIVRAVVAGCWESLERARGNQQLEEASTRLHLALLAAELGDWSWEMSTDVVTLSERASEIFGIPGSPQMTWQVVQELLPDEDRRRTLRILEHAIAAREHYDAEYRVNRPDGTQVWVSSKGRAYYSDGGTPIRMYGVVQDISRQKRLEEDLRVHLAELAEADRKKNDFIALLAHELRNPLAPIRTGLEVIRKGIDNPRMITQVSGMMERQISHMVHLIDDLLDVSRITQGKLVLRMERLELGEVIHRTLEAVGPQLQEARIQVGVDLPLDRIIIEGDVTRLIQVFGNLLGNSAKFTAAGGSVNLRIILRDGKAEVSVTDDGIGIVPEMLPRVFDMFVQAQSPGTTLGGLGLGLALTRTLVEMHGGTVAAESDGLGKGSTFTVILPTGVDPLSSAVAGR